MDLQINETYSALLDQEWILDLDATLSFTASRKRRVWVTTR